MAGVKGKSGGKRSGSGRKPLPPEKLNLETPIPVTEIIPTVDEIAKPKKPEKTQKAMKISDMRNLKCPIEFENMPYAKQAWEYVLDLDKQSKLLTDRQFENLKSYCLAVEVRQNLIQEWEIMGKQTTIVTRNGELKVNPVVAEISKQSDRINSFANDLGLTIMGEFKVAKEKQSSPKLSDNKDKSNDEDLFD